MNLIYSFYIFMIIVKVSNSINQNYAVIYYDNHFAYDYLYVNGLIYFAPYRHTIHLFDLQQIDPQDYFLSIHNPYYYFIPSPSPTSGFEDHIDSISRELNHYKKKNIIFSLTASSYELRLSGIDPKYWHKRPKFYTLNLNITNACILYNLSCNYGENVEDFKTEMNHIQYQYGNRISALDSQDIVTFDKVIEKKTDDAFTVVPKFYIIKNNEYDTLRKLMKYLPFKGETTEEYMNRYEPGPPKSEETIDDYLDRHEDTVKYYFYLNKNLSGHFQNYPIQTMSIDRVKNLKLPYLLRFESYNIYVLRMKTMGIVPFHLDFFKKKYKLFLDWKQVTIFEELGVDLKKNVTLELTTSGQ